MQWGTKKGHVSPNAGASDANHEFGDPEEALFDGCLAL